MHGIQKVLAMILMLSLLLGLCAAAQADTAQPDEAWLKEHLLTEIPAATEGDPTVQAALTETKITTKGNQVTVQGTPSVSLNENTLTINLRQITVEDKAQWILDCVKPLTAEDPQQANLPENDETLTAPTAIELAALIELQGHCDHGDIALALSDVKYSVVTYKDATDAVLARVTFRTADVASAVTASLDETHGSVTLNDLQVLFTLTQTDAETADWDLNKIQLYFSASCKKAVTYHTVKYVDGCNGQVFATETYKVRHRTLTPYCDASVYADEFRPGYTFAGWTPEFAEKVKKDVTYTALWDVKLYSITYAGLPEGAVNTNPAVYTIEDTVQLAPLSVDGFIGWVDANGNTVTTIPAGSTGDVTLTALILDAPAGGPGNGNSVMNKSDYVWATFHCTTCDEHHDFNMLSLFGNAYNTTRTWDAQRKAYVGTVDINVSSMLHYSTGSVVKAMGGIKHYHASNAEYVTLHGVWVPDASARFGGLWYPDGETPVINVTCFTQPVAPTAEQLSSDVYKNKSAKFFIRDWTLLTNYVRQNTLLPGTFTVGEMSEPVVSGKSTTWTVPITVTDLTPYVALMNGKSTGTYKVDWDATTTSLTYNMKYTFTPSSKNLEPDQTGTKWTISLPSSETNNGKQIWLLPQWTTIYTDGADGAVFETKTIVYPTSTKDVAQNVLKKGSIATPAFGDAPVRDGFTFLGWNPEISEKLTDSVTYTAQWEINVYDITYAGVPEGVTNSNPSTYTVEGTVQLAPLSVDGFVGWVDTNGNTVTTIPAGSTGDVTLTANIIAKPTMPKIGTNIAPDLMTFQCTAHAEHNWTTNTTISANTKRTYWNSASKRWETFVYAQYYNINTTTTKKNYFGGLTHHYADDAQSVKIYLYWNPTAAGQTSLGAAVTGQWYAVDGNPITLNVWCYDKPAAPSKISTYLWVRDWTNTSNWVRVSSIVDGTYTVSDVYEEKGSFFVDVTINNLSAYIGGMAKKSTGTYIIDSAQTSNSMSYRMKYTGSTTDYKQDGTGWTLYKDEWTNSEKNSGKTVWVIPQWTTTYTDGAEGAVFADKVITYPTSSEGIPQNAVKNGKLLTPSFGDAPVRDGFAFTGWDPAISEKLTASVTYTAQWEAIVPEVTPEPAPSEDPEPSVSPEPDASVNPDPSVSPEPDASMTPEPSTSPEPDASAEPTPTASPEPDASEHPDPSESPATDEGNA